VHQLQPCETRRSWFAVGTALLAAGFLVVAMGAPVLVTAQDEPTEEMEAAILAPLASKSLLLDVTVTGNGLVAVGERGIILLSDDSGESWRQVAVPTRANLTGVCFRGEGRGWAVGHDSVVLRTVDGGATWAVANFAPEEETPLLDVWCADDERGFAIGAYGTFLVTSDGGETWEFRPISDYDFHLHHVARSATGKIYMAAEAGMVYRSDDDGETWIELPSPYEGSFFAALPMEDDVVLLFGLRGHLYRSEDAGETWTELETGTVAMLTDGLDLGGGRVVITGLGGTLLYSSDGGRSFDLRPRPTRRGISAAAVAPDGAVVLVGEGGSQRLIPAELAAERKD
jgi:photosystem II stability/assembly factor-like uncharacterized protein